MRSVVHQPAAAEAPNRLGRKRPHLRAATGLIAVFATAIVLQLVTLPVVGDSPIFAWFRLQPDFVFSRGQVWRLFTYGLFHNSESLLLHGGLSVALLLLVARPAERLLGSVELLCVVVASLLTAGLVACCTWLISRHAGHFDFPLPIIGCLPVGVSLLLLLAVHQPDIPLPYVRMRPIAVLIITFTLQFLCLAGSDSFAALFAVTPAAVAGLLAAAAFAVLYVRSDISFVDSLHDSSRDSVRVPNSHPVTELRIYRPTECIEPDYTQRTDSILRKISRSGMSELTPRERRILQQAGRQSRNRRMRS